MSKDYSGSSFSSVVPLGKYYVKSRYARLIILASTYRDAAVKFYNYLAKNGRSSEIGGAIQVGMKGFGNTRKADKTIQSYPVYEIEVLWQESFK